MWSRSARLLTDPKYFSSERERVLMDFPSLNSNGLGQSKRRRSIPSADDGQSCNWEFEYIPDDLEAARNELRANGRYESGIRNTLEYFVEGRVSLSYRLKGCGWARRFNGPAPPKCSSYGLKHRAESYLRNVDERRKAIGPTADLDRYIANGAFICAALMAGLRIWTYRDSINPDLRVGAPWAVAGMQPADYGHPDDEHMARFWRWVVQQDASDPLIEDFIVDTVELLYHGADLCRLNREISCSGSEAQVTFDHLRRRFRNSVT